MSKSLHLSLITIAVSYALPGSAGAAPPADSAYSTDPQSSHVEDSTSQGIGQVNMITCFMAAMEPDQLVNKGEYIALVNESVCDQSGRSSSSNSSSSGTQTASYTTATVSSTRASNADPMLVSAWVDQTEEGFGGTIFVRGAFEEPSSEDNPYGVFRMDYCGSFGGAGCMMRGFIEGRDGELDFFNEEGGGEFSSTVALRLTSVGTTTGSGEMSIAHTFAGETESQQFLFAYDDAHFLRGEQCFSRDASDPETGFSVWRYGLYDPTSGARVERNSGFPIEYSVSGKTYHGYLGYWGLHLPPDVVDELPSGTTVQKVEYSSGEEPVRTDYTIVRAGGKLMRYTKQTRTLQGIDKIRLHTWIGEATGLFDGATSSTDYTMYWDDENSVMMITGQVQCGDNGCHVVDFDTEHAVPLTYWSSSGGLRGWSEALGGDLFIALHDLPEVFDSAAIEVVYRAQDLVYPDDMPETLYCLSSCPSAASMESYFSGSGGQSPYVEGTYNNWQPSNSPVVYSTDAAAGVIKDAADRPVLFTDREAAQSDPQYQNGIHSGRLFADLAAVECEPDSGTYCDHRVNTLDVYYGWETGPNTWNQLALVKDENDAYVQFDAPLQVTFSVPNEPAYGDSAGRSIVLQYGTFGELWGIPGACVSRHDNRPVSCENPDSRYVAEFMIPYDETIGHVSSAEGTYLVKWLEREIRFARKDASECAGLVLPAGTVLPTAADVQDPSDPQSDIYIGAKPAVTDPPRVVHGVVKF